MTRWLLVSARKLLPNRRGGVEWATTKRKTNAMSDRQTIKAADAASRKYLQHIIKLNKLLPGFNAAMAQEMSKRLGKKIHRQSMALWLHDNDKKRIEPRLGVGLILVEVGKVVAKNFLGE